MKKFLIIFAVAVMLMSIASCKKGGNNANSGTDAAESTKSHARASDNAKGYKVDPSQAGTISAETGEKAKSEIRDDDMD